MTRTLDLPADPVATTEVAAILAEHTRSAREFTRHAWAWAGQVSRTQAEAETAYFAVHDAAGVQPATAPDPEAGHVAKSDPAPKAEPKPRPDPEPDADDDPDPDPDGDGDPEPSARAPVSAPTPDPLPDHLARQLTALAARVDTEEPHVAANVPKWDPDETPTLAGQVAYSEYADLRQRAGPVRILVLRTTDGPVEIWASWQQLGALLRAEELANGRAIQPGDLLAIRAAGKQRVGKSRSPSRLFTLAIQWAS